MTARTTAKNLRRRSLAVVDQLSYIPLSRLAFNIMLDVLVSGLTSLQVAGHFLRTTVAEADTAS
jgi:hypothetical protein